MSYNRNRSPDRKSQKERIKELTDELENGYTFTAEEKEAIRKFAEENSERELSDEELSQATGGWACLFYQLGYCKTQSLSI